MSNLTIEHQETLMKYLGMLTKLQDADVKVNNEINDVVTVLHEGLGLRRNKSKSHIQTERLINELRGRSGVQYFHVGDKGFTELKMANDEFQDRYIKEYKGKVKVLVITE